MLIKRKLFSKDEKRKESDKKWDSVLGAGLGTAAGISGALKINSLKSVKKLKNATNARINKVHDYLADKMEEDMQKKINSSSDPFNKYVTDEARRKKHDIINNARRKMIKSVGKKKKNLKIATSALPVAGAILGATYGYQNNLKKQRNKIEDAAGDRVAEIIKGKKKKE